jgi:hypothetical protein
MYKLQVNNRVLFSLLFFSVALVLFSSSVIVFPNQAIAAGKFTITPKINIKKLNNPQKLKVVAYSNGENKTKYLTGNDLKSNTATVSFQFKRKMTLLLLLIGMNMQHVLTTLMHKQMR